MRNYIVINGVDSRSIEGLLIQSLPPIVKPRKRYEIEEIDGKDGDYVNVFGYGSSDPEFEIGLYGNYDINKVISFFDSEGQIIFSNEPDKYYNFQFLEEIDFERLVLFRTATIQIHLQPFKYPIEIQPVTQLKTTDDGKEMLIYNRGNKPAKPIITIEGSGDITVSLNGSQALQINLGDDGYITIDVGTLEAHKDTVLKNRLCTGDYDNLTLPVGYSTLLFTGTVDAVSVTDYIRWL